MKVVPDAVKPKLLSLQLQRGASEDAQRGAASRLSALPRNADEMMVQRLTSERDKHFHRLGQLSQLLNKINQWIGELKGDVTLEAVPNVTIELKPGETLATLLGNARDAIAEKRKQLALIKAAPLPKGDKMAAIEQHVLRLASQAKPQIFVRDQGVKINWRGDMVVAEDVAALLCWMEPALMCEALCREIDAQSGDGALSAADRVKSIFSISAELLDLERHEESLICFAADDGQEILRRPDADPRAVLGVVVVKAAPAAQVA
jgi:hypothetical protein